MNYRKHSSYQEFKRLPDMVVSRLNLARLLRGLWRTRTREGRAAALMLKAKLHEGLQARFDARFAQAWRDRHRKAH